MTYELAKQLKEARFPQNPLGYSEAPKSWVQEDGTIRDWFNEDSDCYIPTLDELIEACGEVTLMVGIGRAVALNAKNPLESNKRGDGSTSKEAVAKLWLELKK